MERVLCLNDLALTVSERVVAFDNDYKQAQLAGGGVAIWSEMFEWADVVKFRSKVNEGGRQKELYGTIRMTEACHLICET